MVDGYPTAAYPGDGEYCSALNVCSWFQSGFRARIYNDRSYALGPATDSDTPSITFINPNADFPWSLLGPKDQQSARIDGQFQILSAGTYSFYIWVNKEAKFFIDGALLITNQYCVQLGPFNKYLSAGYHDLYMEQWDWGGMYFIHLQYSGPDTQNIMVPLFASYQQPQPLGRFNELNPINCHNHCPAYSDLTWQPCDKLTCIDCSPSSISIVAPSYTVNQIQPIFGPDYTFKLPPVSVQITASLAPTTRCDPITYSVFEPDGSTPSTYFENIVVFDSSTQQVIVTLKPEYQMLLGTYSFSLRATPQYGAQLAIPIQGSLQLQCNSLTIIQPSNFITSVETEIGPLGSTITYTWSPFTTNYDSQCPVTQYGVFHTNDNTFGPLIGVTFTCPTQPCFSMIVANDASAPIQVYVRAVSGLSSGYSQLVTFTFVCGVSSTTLIDPATSSPQIQYGSISISSSMKFQLNAYSSSNVLCDITDYLVSYQNPTIDVPSDLTSPNPVSPLTDPVFIQSNTAVDKNHMFFVRVSADGGAFKWITTQFSFKIGCGTFVNVYLTTDFVDNQTFELMITDPAHKYEIFGFVSESPYCKIAKYELVPVENTDSLVFPHQDGSLCNPTEPLPPICDQICPTELDATPVCSISTLSSENGLQCNSIASASSIGICNKIQVITQEVKVMKFKIRAYIGDLSISAIDTSTAGFKESPLVIVSTICGPSSTSIISVLSSAAHPTASSGTIDIFLDENNVAGSVQRFTVFLDKMSSVNQNCPIISYQISSSTVTPINLLSNPNLQQPVLTQDGYSIQLFTGLIQQYQFYIIANADGGATNLNQPPPYLTINIICGSENISHDLNLPNLITSINSDGVQAIELMITRNQVPAVQSVFFNDATLQLSSVFRTDKSQCGLVRYEVYSDSSLQTRMVNDPQDPDTSAPFKVYNEHDPAQAQFKFFDSGAYFKNVYIKGISQGNKFSVVPIIVAVCGFEKVILTDESPLILTYKQDTSSSGKYIEWSDIDKFFKYERGPYSLDQCNSDLTKLYVDANGQFERTSLDITNQVDIQNIMQNQIKLKINNQESFSEQHFYLARITKGLVRAMKHIIIEVCGHEKVLLTSKNDKVELEYSSAKRDSNPYSFEDYKKFFMSSSNKCKITKYELVQTLDGIPYKSKSVQLGPDYSIKVNEVQNFKSQQLYIKASTEQGLYPAYLPLQITVDFEQSQELKNALNLAPNFDNSPNNTMVYVTNSTSLTTKIRLSTISDDEEQPVEMQIFSEQVGRIIYSQETSLQSFSPQNTQGIIMEYERETNLLVINFPNKELMQGSLNFDVFLTDIRQKTRQYSFKVDFIEFDQSFLDKLINSTNHEQKDKRATYSVTAYIKSIDFFGNMIIKFSSQMRTEIVNITELNSTYFDLYVAPSNNWHEFEPTFNISNLNFTWNVTAYERDEMRVKLNFSNPNSISLKKIHDSVVFHIKNASYFFQSKEKPNDYLNELFYTLKRKIPRQIKETENVKMIKQATLGFKSMMKTSLVGSFVLNIFIAGSLNQLLAFINSLQLILHLPIMNLKIPANALSFFQIVLPIVLFDILENIEYIENIFGQQNEDSIVLDQMKQLGYENSNTILNLKTIFVLMIFYFLKLIFLFIIIIIVKYCNKGKKLQQSLQKQVIFSEFIYLFTEGYIEFLISGLIGLQVPQDSQNDIFIVHATTYVVNILTLLVLPGMIIYILIQPMERLRSEEFKKIWFASYKSSNLSEDKSRLFSHFIYVVRRIIFVTIAFKLEEKPFFQIQILLFLSTFTMMYQGYFEPFIERSKNRIEFFNEICIYICSVHLVCFTLFVPDNDIQNSCGWSLICVICINTLVNLVLFFRKVIRNLLLVYIKFKRRCLKKYQKIKDEYFTNEQEHAQQKEVKENKEEEKNNRKIKKDYKNSKQSFSKNTIPMANVIKYKEPEITNVKKLFIIGDDESNDARNNNIQLERLLLSLKSQNLLKRQGIKTELTNNVDNQELQIPQSRYIKKPRKFKKKKKCKKKKVPVVEEEHKEQKEEQKQAPQYSEAFINSALYQENFKPQMEIFEKFRAQRRIWQLEEQEREQRKDLNAKESIKSFEEQNRSQQLLVKYGIEQKYKSLAMKNSRIKPN